MSEIKSKTEGYEELDDPVMSNFDHEIDNAVADKLKTGKFVAQYSGWNFCGYVHWNGERYTCVVWRYNSPVDEVSGSLEEIMSYCCDKYGGD